MVRFRSVYLEELALQDVISYMVSAVTTGLGSEENDVGDWP